MIRASRCALLGLALAVGLPAHARGDEAARVKALVAQGRAVKADARCGKLVLKGVTLEGPLREACALARLEGVRLAAERSGDVAPLDAFREEWDGTEAANEAYHQAARVLLGWSARDPALLWDIVERYPNAVHAPQARTQLWEGVRERRDVEEVMRFQGAAVDTPQARMAHALEGDLRFEEARAEGSIEALEGFLAEFGDHRRTAEVRLKVAEARFADADVQEPAEALATAEAYPEHPDAPARREAAMARLAVTRTVAPARVAGLRLGGRAPGPALPGGTVITVSVPDRPVGPVVLRRGDVDAATALKAAVGARARDASPEDVELRFSTEPGRAHIVLPAWFCGGPQEAWTLEVTVSGLAMRYPVRPDATCDAAFAWRAPRAGLDTGKRRFRMGMTTGALRTASPEFRGNLDLQGVSSLCAGSLDDQVCVDFYKDALFAVRGFCRGFLACTSPAQYELRNALGTAVRRAWSVETPIKETVSTAPNVVALDFREERPEDGIPEARLAVYDAAIFAALTTDSARYAAWKGASSAPAPGPALLRAVQASPAGVLPGAATDRPEVIHGTWCPIHGSAR